MSGPLDGANSRAKRARFGLKPAPVGKRLTFWDSAVPGLCIRVTDKGSASFTVMRRLRGQPFPIRRVIGFAWKIPHPAGQPLPYSLADARGDARAAVRDISLGVDPKVKWAAQREAEAQSTRTVFAAVAKEFLADHVAGLRSANQVRAIFKNELIPVFGKRPIAEISDQDIARPGEVHFKNPAISGPSCLRQPVETLPLGGRPTHLRVDGIALHWPVGKRFNRQGDPPGPRSR